MSTLHQLTDGFSRAWDSITEGWRELVDRAGEALTRFQPGHGNQELQTREEAAAYRGARWGVLAAEVKFDDQHVQVALEVPGMHADGFDISVVDDVLVVRGEKKVERESAAGRYHIMERAYGAFERAIRLPVAVDESGAKARYRRGVLNIKLPRSESTKTRRIEVVRG